MCRLGAPALPRDMTGYVDFAYKYTNTRVGFWGGAAYKRSAWLFKIFVVDLCYDFYNKQGDNNRAW